MTELHDYLAEQLQEILRDAGVELGSVGGAKYREVIAGRMTRGVNRIVEAAKADAWDEGYRAGSDAEVYNDTPSNPHRQGAA